MVPSGVAVPPAPSTRSPYTSTVFVCGVLFFIASSVCAAIVSVRTGAAYLPVVYAASAFLTPLCAVLANPRCGNALVWGTVGGVQPLMLLLPALKQADAQQLPLVLEVLVPMMAVLGLASVTGAVCGAYGRGTLGRHSFSRREYREAFSLLKAGVDRAESGIKSGMLVSGAVGWLIIWYFS